METFSTVRHQASLEYLGLRPATTKLKITNLLDVMREECFLEALMADPPAALDSTSRSVTAVPEKNCLDCC